MLDIKAIDEICEKNNFYDKIDETMWSDGAGIMISQSTPEGEDWSENFNWDNDNIQVFIDSLKSRIDGWDSEEEAMPYIEMRGQRGVPSSIRDLLDDADWKLEQLKALYTDLINYDANNNYKSVEKKTEALDYVKAAKQINDISTEEIVGYLVKNKDCDARLKDIWEKYLALNKLNVALDDDKYIELDNAAEKIIEELSGLDLLEIDESKQLEKKTEARLTDYLGIMEIRDILQQNPATADKEFAIIDDMKVEVGVGDDVKIYKAIKNDEGNWELLEENKKLKTEKMNKNNQIKVEAKRVAYDIEWDIDDDDEYEDEDDELSLPTEVVIPDDIDDDDIEDYLSDLTGFCHYGYKIKKLKENKKLKKESVSYNDLVRAGTDLWRDGCVVYNTIIDGIYDCTTDGHGGYLVDTTIFPELAKYGDRTIIDNIVGFEEDYEALKVLWVFPQLIKSEDFKNKLNLDMVLAYDEDKSFAKEFPTMGGNIAMEESKNCIKEEKTKLNFIENVDELPDMCYGVLPSDNSIIIIKKGERGYFLTNKDYERAYADIIDWNLRNDKADEICNKLNAELGVTPDQRFTMEIRSMNGNWGNKKAEESKKLQEEITTEEIDCAKTIADIIYKKGIMNWTDVDEMVCDMLKLDCEDAKTQDIVNDVYGCLTVYNGLGLNNYTGDFYTQEYAEKHPEVLEESKDASNISNNNIADTFKNYEAFKNNFEDIIIVKSPYNKNYLIYNMDAKNDDDYIYYSDSKDNIEGWLAGAVKANNNVIKLRG